MKIADSAQKRLAPALQNGQSERVSDEPEPLDLSRSTTLASALAEAPTRDRGWSIYVPLESRALNLATPCLWVFDLWDDVEADASEAGWRPGLTVDDLAQIRDNLQLQREHVDLVQLAAATDHYFQHDAFIDLSPN